MIFYKESIKSFIQDNNKEILEEGDVVIINKLTAAFKKNFDKIPKKVELNFWRKNLLELSKIFSDLKLEKQEIIIDYPFPLDSRRLYCVILGANEDKKENEIIIIELKKWDEYHEDIINNYLLNLSHYENNIEVLEKFNEVLTHPSVEMKNYVYSLNEKLSQSKSVKLNGCVFLFDCKYSNLFSKEFKRILNRYPVFNIQSRKDFKDCREDFKDYLKKRIFNSCSNFNEKLNILEDISCLLGEKEISAYKHDIVNKFKPKKYKLNCEKKVFKNGNKMLKSTENIKFKVFNLPIEMTCPYKTKTCRKSCYEKKSEEMHKGKDQDSSVVKFRKRCLVSSLKDDFAYNCIKILTNTKKEDKITYVRIHTSGDFYNYEYFKKWIEIAHVVRKKRKDIEFVAYTKSIKYLVKFLKDDKEMLTRQAILGKENLALNDLPIKFLASVMEDSKWAFKKDVKLLGTREYRVVNPAEFKTYKEEKVFICKIKEGSCSSCLECYKHTNTNTAPIITVLR